MSTLTAPRVGIHSSPLTNVRREPSGNWYWVAGLVAILGVAASVGWGATRTLDAYRSVDSFARARIPGIVNVAVDEAGKQLVYYEGDRRPGVNDLGLEIRGPSGGQIAVRPYLLDLRYDFDGELGKAVAVFRAKVPGRYAVESSRAPEDDAHLAVGGDLTSIIPTILASLGLSLLSLVVGAGIAAVAGWGSGTSFRRFEAIQCRITSPRRLVHSRTDRDALRTPVEWTFVPITMVPCGGHGSVDDIPVESRWTPYPTSTRWLAP